MALLVGTVKHGQVGDDYEKLAKWCKEWFPSCWWGHLGFFIAKEDLFNDCTRMNLIILN